MAEGETLVLTADFLLRVDDRSSNVDQTFLTEHQFGFDENFRDRVLHRAQQPEIARSRREKTRRADLLDALVIEIRLVFVGVLSFEEETNQFRLIDQIFRFARRGQLDERFQTAFDQFLDATMHLLVVEIDERSHRFARSDRRGILRSARRRGGRA